MSLFSVWRGRNSVPNMPNAVISIRPPKASSALADMSLFSRATKLSVLIVILPPVAVPVALVVMLLLRLTSMQTICDLHQRR